MTCLFHRLEGIVEAKLLLESLRTAKLSSGRRLLEKWYATGQKLTRGQAMTAKCCECMCFYEDGKQDCENQVCPMYPYVPYRKKNGIKIQQAQANNPIQPE